MQTNGEFFADKIMDLANLVFSTLVFGQLLTERIRWPGLIIGFSFFWLCVVLSYWLRKGRRKKQ